MAEEFDDRLRRRFASRGRCGAAAPRLEAERLHDLVLDRIGLRPGNLRGPGVRWPSLARSARAEALGVLRARRTSLCRAGGCACGAARLSGTRVAARICRCAAMRRRGASLVLGRRGADRRSAGGGARSPRGGSGGRGSALRASVERVSGFFGTAAAIAASSEAPIAAGTRGAAAAERAAGGLASGASAGRSPRLPAGAPSCTSFSTSEVGRPADHDQVLDVVAADEDELPPLVDLRASPGRRSARRRGNLGLVRASGPCAG